MNKSEMNNKLKTPYAQRINYTNEKSQWVAVLYKREGWMKDGGMWTMWNWKKVTDSNMKRLINIGATIVSPINGASHNNCEELALYLNNK